MQDDFARRYHLLEEKHWWFVGRQEVVLALVKKLYPDRKQIKILEIGCSGGPLLKLLSSQGYSQIFGVDISKQAIRLCKKRGLKKVFLMNGVKPEFDSEEFDLIIASDVLEHIRDDDKAVKEWVRILKKGGLIICFVPARKILWSKHDEDNEHYRRYTKKGLEFIFRKNDCRIIRSSCWNFTLFLPTVLYRFLIRSFLGKSSISQLRESNYVMNLLLIQLLRLENFFLNIGVNYPIGISVFVIAKKPNVPKISVNLGEGDRQCVLE